MRKVKQPRVYKVDLTKIQGEGDFPCPNCGVIIAPEDETEEVYHILETKSNGEALEELVIKCNNCGSKIWVVGFLVSETDNPCGREIG
jgi:ribosomal protein S27AE